MTIPLEKNQSMPENRGTITKYPWAMMKVGDSFFVPNRKPADFSTNKRTASRKYKAKYACRTVKGGTRVWRVK